MNGEEYGLRSDISKNHGVTTVIGSNNDLEHGDKPGFPRKQSTNAMTGHNRWANSTSRLADSSSEDGLDWDLGIKKTTVTNVER